MNYVTIDEAGRAVGRSSAPTTAAGYRSILHPQELPPGKVWAWNGAAFVEAPGSSADAAERAWLAVRRTRSRLLQACDWTQGADSPLSLEQRERWAAYRRQLRDITTQPDPLAIRWPLAPSN